VGKLDLTHIYQEKRLAVFVFVIQRINSEIRTVAVDDARAETLNFKRKRHLKQKNIAQKQFAA
jgi:hypothetical protein